MIATWYVTEAGDAVDPAECARKDGVLVHKSGAKIEMRFPDCPRSRSVDTETVKAPKASPKVKPVDPEVSAVEIAAEVAQVEVKDVKPEGGDLVGNTPVTAAPKRGYRTRETKAE